MSFPNFLVFQLFNIPNNNDIPNINKTNIEKFSIFKNDCNIVQQRELMYLDHVCMLCMYMCMPDAQRTFTNLYAMNKLYVITVALKIEYYMLFFT